MFWRQMKGFVVCPPKKIYKYICIATLSQDYFELQATEKKQIQGKFSAPLTPPPGRARLNS